MVREKSLLSAHPFLRFTTGYHSLSNEVRGPRICYIPSYYLIIKGTGTLTLSDKTYLLQPGVHLFIEAGKVHTWKGSDTDPFQFKAIYFEWNYHDRPLYKSRLDFIEDIESKRDNWINPSIETGLPEYSFIPNTQTWLNHYDRINGSVEVIDSSIFTESLQSQAYFMLMLDYILSLANPNKLYFDARVTKVINKIECHAQDIRQVLNEMTEPYSVNELIALWINESGVGRSRFYTLFKQQTGLSPSEYMQACRLNYAKKALRDTILSITVIAEKYGYSGVHNFSKAFKKKENTSPTEYRNAYRIY